MDREELAGRIDHAVLGPTTTPEDVRRCLDGALSYGMNACVPPCYVPEATEYAPNVRLVTVVGFPGGQHATAAKREEATVAWEEGADEVETVVNAGRLKAGETDAVRHEIEEVVASVPIPVTVIAETGVLSESEKHAACQAAADAGAAFVRTSTGFAVEGRAPSAGVDPEDVRLMAEYLPVKASGGVDSWGRARAVLDAGAERVSTVDGVAVMDGFAVEGE